MFVAAASDKTKQKKDTHTNIIATKEFVVNFATSTTRKKMNLTSKDVHQDEDEFLLTNLKKRKSRLVKVPSVASSPVNLECKLLNIIKLKSNTKKNSTMIIGEVIGIYIKDSFIKKGRVDSTAMRYIARMGYSEYTTVSSNFKMKRP
jgi:flavin reductase (DIM6/NTAB) family NADH-FMN oxidoreductase RutF